MVPHIVPFDLQDVVSKKERLNFVFMSLFEGFLGAQSIEIEKRKKIKSKRDRHFIDFVELFYLF